MKRIAARLLVAILPCTLAAQAAPLIDYHAHLFSPAAVSLPAARARGGVPSRSASELIASLDSAGIRRAVVLSLGYQLGIHGSPWTAST